MNVSLERPVLEPREFKKLSNFIERELGIRMPEIKRIMLESRLHKRLRVLKLNNFAEYCDYLFSDTGMRQEFPFMIDVVTTNKTDFFREPDHFVYLENSIVRPYLDRSHGSGSFDIWSSASSTGEEIYTLAMVLEGIREDFGALNYTILGSDISQEVLAKARKGVYHNSRIETIPMNLKKKYFLKSKNKSEELVKVKPIIQRNVSFVQQNLMHDKYDIKKTFDIIFCRNVLIYFSQEKQKKILLNLHSHLKPDGTLFLGHSETITGLNLPFLSVAPTIYRKN
ncbi:MULTISPECIES: protein-glutamate O-methyltransferase CheR [unclassified Oceanispirochaeta]|uniref:CheR family methyltransferase n=1 Tax=unclassified Oceanispirochaeta TaxID=2635722 RepID=UPI000E094ED2|nr:MULTISPECIES: CheR family methyltransferase [unclassified Oceanispirochaeta]MBF9015647.1 methyltransferase [Oceanispirochaeta sp. M2]NPD73421.1 methyltransferase [Oceanispirochaeta sp. M1]RDG30894.1 methyltransferase [Oceanispirochaeta sp. M1]